MWSFALDTISFDGEDVPRFADAGFTAAVLGWAAFARSYPRATLRPLLTTTALWAVLIGLVMFLDSAWGRAVVDAVRADDSFAAVILRSGPIIAVDLADVVGVFFVGVLGALARASVVARTSVRRRCAAAVVVVAMVVMARPSDGREVVATVLFGIVATAWLVWALRRARAEHVAREAASPVAATTEPGGTSGPAASASAP